MVEDMHVLIETHLLRGKKQLVEKQIVLDHFYNGTNAYETIATGKIMARAWAKSFSEAAQHIQAETFLFQVITAYWQKVHGKTLAEKPLPALFEKIAFKKLDHSVLAVARAIGNAAAALGVIEAGYQLGNVYTAVLTETTRSNRGVFYTPPSLTNRLINLSENAGVNWAHARVVDPACGGGAFLAPVCLRKVAALKAAAPKEIIHHMETHVAGLEIDPFGGWLTQVFAEVALKDILIEAGIAIKPLVRICNSLELEDFIEEDSFDLVIGNPPYGKTKLTDAIRNKFKGSLYGHPNLYGLFTHLALNLTKANGIIALLTPTSFLSGEYFKQLRQLLRIQSQPLEIDFVSFRKGVFEDVLQETMLAIYSKTVAGHAPAIKVNQITTQETGLHIHHAGVFSLSKDLSAPWVLPRTPEQAAPVHAMQKMFFRLKDWGYKVSTGPLVWNRHKDQLCLESSANTFPIIWSEAITQDGQFILRAEKKNHAPYFKFRKGDEWLVTTKPCILLQRTTAKEQPKRLIAAALPQALLAKTKAVVIENHLNMIIPLVEKPAVSPHVLAAFLNSKAVNDAFRAISGSVAVSAYELESLPLPPAKKMAHLTTLMEKNSTPAAIETACQKIYAL